MNQPDPSRPAFDFEAVFEVDDYLYFYGDSLTAERSNAEVQFLVQALELDQPLSILDLACGFGRHANRLAALGHQVTGIDLTPGFLELARQDAAALGVTVAYRAGDMRQLDFLGAFDRVLLLFTAFGYFDDEENEQVLVRIARALRPGGFFIVDVQNRDAMSRMMQPNFVTEKDGNLMIERQSFDIETGRMYNQRIVYRNGVRKDKPFFVRMYTFTELRDLLLRTGLEVVKTFGGWDGGPLTFESRRMIVVARKKM